MARFIKDVDFTGFKPIPSQFSGKIFGASLGSGKEIIGWYRDATCEPPNWNLQPIITKQTVVLTVPASAINWKVDFYNTQTGTDIVSSSTVPQIGNTVTITLPDFMDDIAFKMYIQN